MYSDDFPIELSPYIDKYLYMRSINEINDILSVFWPCLPASIFGYLCCPCSLGLSLLMPYTCIKDAETVMMREIDRLNGEVFEPRGLKLKYIKKCGNSWMEIELNEKEIEVIGKKLGASRPLLSNEENT